MCIIPEGKPVVHPSYSRRMLYVGHDLALLKFLQGSLEECQTVRCPSGSLAHTLIESQIGYSLFLLDEELPDATGLEVADFTRRVRHCEQTPIMILSASKVRCADRGIFFEKSDNHPVLVSAIQQLLAAPQ